MNINAWNVMLLGMVNDRLAVAVTSPLVDSWIVERQVGQYPIAHVGKGFATHQQALDFCTGADGKGGLVYDVLYTVKLEMEVTND